MKQARETPDDEKTPDDWHLLFFPWWTDPTYVADGGTIEPETASGNSASANSSRTFASGFATGSLSAAATCNNQGRGNASWYAKEFGFTLDAPLTLYISASVLQEPGSSGGGNVYTRFTLQTIDRGLPLGMYSYNSMLTPPTKEPRFTVDLQVGTYVFFVESGADASVFASARTGLDYRLDTVPEPSVAGLFVAALLPLNMLRRCGRR